MSSIGSWYETHRRILNFAAAIPADRYIRVRGEDVLNDSVPQLRAIAAWLKLRTDDGAIEAMQHPEESPFAKPGPLQSGVVGGHDPGFLRDPIPHRVHVPRSLAPPNGWAADLFGWKMVVTLANRLGYVDEGEAK
jgi:hypothetical protein